MNTQKRHDALPFIGVIMAALLIAGAYFFVEAQVQKKQLADLNEKVTRYQEQQKQQGRPVDPRDYPLFSPAPTKNEKQMEYAAAGMSLSYPTSWQIKEADGLITLASQAALLDGQIVPADQGKITVRSAAMSWVANVEQLTTAYTTKTRKITVNDRQVFELTNEDKDTNTTWIEAYVMPKEEGKPYGIITVYPSQSEAAMNAYQNILKTLKVGE